MTIRFHLNFKDLTAFQEDVIKHAHTHHIKRAYFKWITSIILFLAIMFLTKTSFVTIVASLILTIIYFTIFPYLYAKIAFLKLSKQMQKNDYSHVLGACEMIFSDAGIDRNIKGKITHFDWGQFINWQEDSHHYFLYVSDLQGLIIPKELDDMNEEELDTYKDRMRTQLNFKINQ